MEKAEVEEKSVENSKEHIEGETLPRRYQSANGQMQESLSVMNEETLELREFILQKETRIKELYVLLKQVLKQLTERFQ